MEIYDTIHPNLDSIHHSFYNQPTAITPTLHDNEYKNKGGSQTHVLIAAPVIIKQCFVEEIYTSSGKRDVDEVKSETLIPKVVSKKVSKVLIKRRRGVNENEVRLV